MGLRSRARTCSDAGFGLAFFGAEVASAAFAALGVLFGDVGISNARAVGYAVAFLVGHLALPGN